MVRKKLDDARRDENEKKHFPWWWQTAEGVLDLNSTEVVLYLNSILENRLANWTAYRYELGRRYLIRERGMPASAFPSVSYLFTGDREKNSAVFFSFASPLTPGSIAHRPVVKVDDKITDEEIDVPGHFQRLDMIAWNLEAPWKSVAATLKGFFEHERIRKRIDKVTRPGGAPWATWQKIEIWDLWEAGCDPPSHVYPKGGSQSHEAKAKKAAKDAEKYAELTVVLAAGVSELYLES